jgi:type VI secretion system protein ImpM
MTPGWYGKLPTLGDFASRRLDADFIEPWDRWLGEGLAAQRAQLGEAWLDAYLQSPVWRFVLLPGVLASAQAAPLAGVLMPSVDRVGRYFPLTLAMPLQQLPRSTLEVEQLLGWLHCLEDLAVDALQGDWSIEQLEDALATLPPVVERERIDDAAVAAARSALDAALAGEPGFVPIDGIRSRSQLAGLFAGALRGDSDPAGPPRAAGRAFWLADSPDDARLLVSHGLPAVGQFVQMLGGSGRAEAETVF